MKITEIIKTDRKLSMLTCYDHSMAKVLAKTKVDMVLVGDSVAMVQHGHESTVHATIEMMELHTKAVARGLKGEKFLVSDMPFGAFRMGKFHALECATKLVRAGADAVKIEGLRGHEDVIEHLIDSGIPVMAHVGLTPQMILNLGGFKVQGKSSDAFDAIVNEAKKLECLGCFSIVLECVPNELSAKITNELKIPTIGIGAGSVTDAQVLVINDLLGMDMSFKPKFLRRFDELENKIIDAVDRFVCETEAKTFPSDSESYLTKIKTKDVGESSNENIQVYT